MARPLLIPAILTNDPGDLQSKLNQVALFAPAVHIDIIDGRFAHNTTLPLSAIAGAKTQLPVELHLLMHNPLSTMEEALSLGFGPILIHHETIADVPEFVRTRIIKDRLPIGIAMNPDTPIDALAHVDSIIPHVCIMGVRPGFQGKKMRPNTVERIELFREHAPQAILEIDGGITKENIRAVAQAGATRIVAGSAIWQHADPKAAYRELLDRLKI